jgi:hypothetical protein
LVAKGIFDACAMIDDIYKLKPIIWLTVECM